VGVGQQGEKHILALRSTHIHLPSISYRHAPPHIIKGASNGVITGSINLCSAEHKLKNRGRIKNHLVGGETTIPPTKLPSRISSGTGLEPRKNNIGGGKHTENSAVGGQQTTPDEITPPGKEKKGTAIKGGETTT